MKYANSCGKKKARKNKDIKKSNYKNDIATTIQNKIIDNNSPLKDNDIDDKETYIDKNNVERFRSNNKTVLNENQLNFIRYYLEDIPHNATKAYQRAYGNENINTCGTNGALLLTHPRIAARIRQAQSEFALKHLITRENVVAGLWNVYQKSLEPVLVTKFTGEPVIEGVIDPETGEEVKAAVYRTRDSKAANQSLGMLAKYLGMDVTGASGAAVNVQVNVELSAMRDEIAAAMQQQHAGSIIEAESSDSA